jgi:hypothetical protein
VTITSDSSAFQRTVPLNPGARRSELLRAMRGVNSFGDSEHNGRGPSPSEARDLRELDMKLPDAWRVKSIATATALALAPDRGVSLLLAWPGQSDYRTLTPRVGAAVLLAGLRIHDHGLYRSDVRRRINRMPERTQAVQRRF